MRSPANIIFFALADSTRRAIFQRLSCQGGRTVHVRTDRSAVAIVYNSRLWPHRTAGGSEAGTLLLTVEEAQTRWNDFAVAEVIIFGAPACMACASSASKARDEGPDAAPPASDLATARHLGRRVAETTLQSVRGRSAVNLASMAQDQPRNRTRAARKTCQERVRPLFFLLAPARQRRLNPHGSGRIHPSTD